MAHAATQTDIETCYKMFTREVLNSLNIMAHDFGMEIQISCQIVPARKWRVYETAIHYYGIMGEPTGKEKRSAGKTI